MNVFTPDLILAVAAFVLPFVWHAAQVLATQQIARLPANARPLVQEIVASGVHFVEQAFSELKGADKKVQAEEVIQRMLKDHKLSASPDEISVLIEEAVFLMNGAKSPDPAPAPVGFQPNAQG
jgi:LL-H family phage holin